MAAFQTLLYYCYTPIHDPGVFLKEHEALLRSLCLSGRVIVASEGLNGTVCGKPVNCGKYMEAVHADPRFAATEFKVEEASRPAFKKLNIRLKKEIVNSGLGSEVKPWEGTGAYVEPSELENYLDREDVVVLDVRSNYEHMLGRFKGARTLNMDHFREFPEKVKDLEDLKEKTVLTYCTGGVKCEKASAYLLKQGFKNVLQLHGGIIKYAHETDGNAFEGKCYVFDNRMSVPVSRTEHKIIGRCGHCNEPCERVVNCAEVTCNRQFILCEDCGWEYKGTCSRSCAASENKRPYDGSGYYARNTDPAHQVQY